MVRLVLLPASEGDIHIGLDLDLDLDLPLAVEDIRIGKGLELVLEDRPESEEGCRDLLHRV